LANALALNILNNGYVGISAANSTVSKASYYLDSVNLGFAAAAFFALCFTLIVTLLNFDFKLRDSHISESEKRLFMFYFPMLKLIESISDNYCYIQDDHKNRIKEISQYRYLMNVDNTDLKDHFIF
jgi:hypothetical protein